MELKKEKKTTEPFWKEIIEVWFDFCKEKFRTEPSFDGASAMALKHLLKEFKRRSESIGLEWTSQCATETLISFLEVAITDPWLSQNFMLKNLNSQKDKVFFKLASNGNSKSLTENSNGFTGSSNTRISALKNWGTTRGGAQ